MGWADDLLSAQARKKGITDDSLKRAKMSCPFVHLKFFPLILALKLCLESKTDFFLFFFKTSFRSGFVIGKKKDRERLRQIRLEESDSFISEFPRGCLAETSVLVPWWLRQ